MALKASGVEWKELLDGFHLDELWKLVDESFGDFDSARVASDVER